VIFIDANVPMYLLGAPHPNKTAAQDLIERLVRERRRLVSSSEVFQEILHRYLHSDHREKIEPAFETLDGLLDEVLPVERRDVFAAKDLLHARRSLSARDALHVAVMRRHQIGEVASFDRGFDAISGITRLPR
jgi:uncharacterized protein